MSSFAFVFDMDGVLVDNNPFHKIALQQFCARHGVNLSEEELREKIYGRTNKDWIRNVFPDSSAEDRKHFAEEKETLYRTLYRPHIQPLEGLLPFLEKIHLGKYPIALATSAPAENVDFTLSLIGASAYFPVILDESFVSKGKPDPEIYEKAAAALGMEAKNCLVFEDSLSGIEAAQKAGCKVVGLTTTHRADELKGTDLVVGNFENLSPDSLLPQIF